MNRKGYGREQRWAQPATACGGTEEINRKSRVVTDCCSNRALPIKQTRNAGAQLTCSFQVAFNLDPRDFQFVLSVNRLARRALLELGDSLTCLSNLLTPSVERKVSKVPTGGILVHRVSPGGMCQTSGECSLR